MSTEEICYVTGNRGKFEEVKAYISQHEPEISLRHVDLDLVEPQTLDQSAIAIEKAKQAWQHIKQPLLIDDAGAYFHAYNKFPGVFTKFVYEGLGFEGMAKLLDQDSRMSFKLFLAYIDQTEVVRIFQGCCSGRFVQPDMTAPFNPRLPYDAVFIPDGETEVYGKLRQTDRFNQFAYRLQAFKKFLTWYRERDER